MMGRTTRRWCAAAAALVLGSVAWAQDEWVRRASEPPAGLRDDRRSDAVLLPVLAELPAPPSAVATLESARLRLAGDAGFDAAARWATSPPAVAALEALAQVTAERDPRRAFAFAQGYGREAVPARLAEAGLFTDLGSEGLLALGEFGYRTNGLDRLAILVNVEASRRLGEGDPAGALAVLRDSLFLERQVADRIFLIEKSIAMARMIGTLERMRDIVYQDFMNGRTLDPAVLGEYVASLSDMDGFMRIDRIAFPTGERLAAEQLVERVYGTGPSVDAARFGAVMAQLESYGRPLRLFGQSGAWAARAGQQASRSEVLDELERVAGDYEAMWPLDPYHPQILDGFYGDTADAERHAAALMAVPDARGLFATRQHLRVELAGTRTALAVAAYAIANRVFPPTLAAVRPRFIDRLEPDAMSPQRNTARVPELGYLASTTAGRSNPPGGWPHQIQVDTGRETFTATVPVENFVVYSVGIDGENGFARRTGPTPFGPEGTDFVLWPPLLSLVRGQGE